MHFKKSRKKESCCFLLQIKSFWALQVTKFFGICSTNYGRNSKVLPKISLNLSPDYAPFPTKRLSKWHHRRPLLSKLNWPTERCLFDEGNVYFLETGSHLVIIGDSNKYTPFSYPKDKQLGAYSAHLLILLNFSNLNWLTARCVFHDGNVCFLETGFPLELTLVIVGDSVATAHRLIFLSTFRALTKGQISTFNTNGMVVTRPFATRSIRICRIIQTQGMITHSG